MNNQPDHTYNGRYLNQGAFSFEFLSYENIGWDERDAGNGNGKPGPD